MRPDARREGVGEAILAEAERRGAATAKAAENSAALALGLKRGWTVMREENGWVHLAAPARPT